MGIKADEKVGAREVSERLARCVSTMVFYKADGESRSGATLLRVEARSLADWASDAGLGDDLDRLILGPLRRELVTRFGDAQGADLGRKFLLKYRAACESQRPGA